MRFPMKWAYQEEVKDPADGTGAAADPKPDPEVEVLRAAKKKAEDDFEAYKAGVEREKMSEAQKLAADKVAADQKAKDADKRAEAAEKKAEKAIFGAKLISAGLKSEAFIDTVYKLRKDGEEPKALAARLKAQEEFSGIFGSSETRSAAPAPKVPGGTPPKDAPSLDADEDERAFRLAFPKDPAAQKAAKERAAKQRNASNGKKNKA